MRVSRIMLVIWRLVLVWGVVAEAALHLACAPSQVHGQSSSQGCTTSVPSLPLHMDEKL